MAINPQNDPNYIQDELQIAAAELNQILDQDGLITEGFKRIRKGQFSGASGLDAVIVALQGGKPLDFTPSYPPNS